MTEEQWLACTDPTPMLEFLKGRASERKVRLFMVASCRRVWDWMSNEGRVAVQACEAYAEGWVGRKELDAGRRAALTLCMSLHAHRAPGSDGDARALACVVALYACNSMESYEPLQVADWAEEAARFLGARTSGDATDARGRGAHCSWLRDLFGPLPFRQVTIDPAWLAWNAGTVRHLVEAAYQERLLPQGTLDPGRLAVLADGLEEAGCANTELLGHLRGPGPHVLGCWCVDALLGKA
jgi:hypothetical protein